MLKLNRYTQWIQALRRANLSPRQWLTLLTIPFTERRATRRTWRRRMSQCVRCPIMDRDHKTCMLCECYMPIKAMFAEQSCAGEIDGVSSARGWDNTGILGIKTDGRMSATQAVSPMELLVEELMTVRLQQNAGRRRGESSLDMPTEAAIARGIDGAQIINDQQEESNHE